MTEVQPLLVKAERAFAAAARLLKSDDLDFAASRAYYGAFYVAQALLLSRGLRFSRHGQVIAQYGRHFARTSLLDPHFHRLLNRAFRLRQLADYAAAPTFDPEVVKELIREGRAFLKAARAYLEAEK